MRADQTDVRRYYELSGPTPISGNMRQALESQRGVSFADCSELRMLAKSGQLDQQLVTYFRIFDPSSVPSGDAAIATYDDVTPLLIRHAGHIDANNLIVMNDLPPRS